MRAIDKPGSASVKKGKKGFGKYDSADDFVNPMAGDGSDTDDG